MPTYTYRCSRHGDSKRNVPVSLRDSQQCDCGRVLSRVFEAPTGIHIPEGFKATCEAITPSDAFQAATWKREGVRPVGKRWV